MVFVLISTTSSASTSAFFVSLTAVVTFSSAISSLFATFICTKDAFTFVVCALPRTSSIVILLKLTPKLFAICAKPLSVLGNS